MKTFHKIYTTSATPEEVFKALTDPKTIEEWSGSPAIMSDKKGASFKLWDGTVYGKNLEVEPNKLLKQEWYGEEDVWTGEQNSGMKSIATFTITETSDRTTKINLLHENIPDSVYESYADGWDTYYMEPLLETIET